MASEDAAEVIALINRSQCRPALFRIACRPKTPPIDPDNTEFKCHAPGIGNVLTISPDSGKRVELISVTHN